MKHCPHYSGSSIQDVGSSINPQFISDFHHLWRWEFFHGWSTDISEAPEPPVPGRLTSVVCSSWLSGVRGQMFVEHSPQEGNASAQENLQQQYSSNSKFGREMYLEA